MGPPSTERVLNLDCAAAARPTEATLAAVVAHLERESVRGGYVAAAEAAETVAGLRADLGTLLGHPADGVALVASASAALDVLLDAWPLPRRGRVGVAPSEWGPNLETFARAGLEPVLLAVDGDGRIDLDSLASTLAADPPDVVHVTQMAAHRGLAQHMPAVLDRCRAAGVPLWVDAAQALGHVPVDHGADATYSTSRKWLAGPRGVGVLAVAERHWDELRARRRAKHLSPLPAVQTLEPEETYVAGRLGLAAAVTDVLGEGAAARFARLEDAGRRTRAAVDGLPGWQVLGRQHTGAITALVPVAGQDPTVESRRLLDEHGIVCTPCLPWRAPGELTTAVLRFSPSADVTDDELERLRDALA